MENTQSSLLITHQQFFTAVESDDIQSLKLILHKFEAQDGHGGASIPSLMSLQNSAGETALYIAAQKNLVHIFSFLLNYCQIHIAMIRSKADLSPFHVAAKCGHLGISFSFDSSISSFGLLFSVNFINWSIFFDGLEIYCMYRN